jgi:hypothetical protein
VSGSEGKIPQDLPLEGELNVLQIARGLKGSGMELEGIVLITGLNLEELEGK